MQLVIATVLFNYLRTSCQLSTISITISNSVSVELSVADSLFRFNSLCVSLSSLIMHHDHSPQSSLSHVLSCFAAIPILYLYNSLYFHFDYIFFILYIYIYIS